jgi:hypothetical protein
MSFDVEEMFRRAANGDKSASGGAASPIDARDYIAYPPAPGAPLQVTVPGVGQCPVYEQLGSTCTGYSEAAILTYKEFKESGQRRTFDGSELHHRVEPSYSNGVWPRLVLDDVKAHGAEAQTSASASGLYRIGGYAAVPLDPESILTNLVDGPLQLVSYLGVAFGEQWRNRTNNYIPAPAAKEEDLLHSTLIVSADRSLGVVIQNNWGINGGSSFAGIPGGFHKVSWEWLWMQGVECWSQVDLSNTETSGWIKNHENVAGAGGFTLVKRPDKPAVYAILGETRDWISSQNELFSRGLGGKPITVKDKSDPVWGYPVVGDDAPADQRA